LTFGRGAQLRASTGESAQLQARGRLVATLSNFTDPFVADDDDLERDRSTGEFNCSVTSWKGELNRDVISADRSFDLGSLKDLEHVIDGEVGHDGQFVGKIKVLGEWLNDEVVIPAPENLPTSAKGHVGPFGIRIGSFEASYVNSTHAKEAHELALEQATLYGGLLIYRDGLRVMPFGREDNDFFEIERRRTLQAGRYFWSNRRMFGRVAITRAENPNLRDKAGREGLIDNRAAKALRDIVTNILKRSAFLYFGTDSPLRKELLPGVREPKEKEKQEAEQLKLRRRRAREFRKDLKRNQPLMETLFDELEGLQVRLDDGEANSEEVLLEARSSLVRYRERDRELALGDVPKNHGPIGGDYAILRDPRRRTQALIPQFDAPTTASPEANRPE